MKRILPLLLILILLSGCASEAPPTVGMPAEAVPVTYAPLIAADSAPRPYTSRFDRETRITLSDAGLTVDGGQNPEGFDGGMPTMPEGEMPSMPAGEPGRDFGSRGDRGNGEPPELPEGETMPADFDPNRMGSRPSGQTLPTDGEGNPLFYMQDLVNFFSGLNAVK